MTDEPRPIEVIAVAASIGTALFGLLLAALLHRELRLRELTIAGKPACRRVRR
jgi:hypothetical protein